MKDIIKTKRLLLNPLDLTNIDFILELVNTDGWIKFIGNRNIKTKEDANNYIQKILAIPEIKYWVVKLQEQSIGIITFIKRDYLEHYDLGFAFLPEYSQKGYAYEASVAVLNEVIKETNHKQILATTVEDNKSSIQLLKKLGFSYDKEIERDNDKLLIYSITKDKVDIDNLVKSFFNLFTNSNNQQPDLNIIHSLCLPETIIISKSPLKEVVSNLDSFIEPRKKILSDGTLTEFTENEISEETKIVGNIAQRFSRYQKSGSLKGEYFKEYGNKFFQFIKTNNGWKINSLIWEDDIKNETENKQMDEENLKALAIQLRQPQGENAVQVGENMNKGNKQINLNTIEALKLTNNDHILEIGMGNGFFVKDILSMADSIEYTGCDYSEAMVEESIKNNQEFIKNGQAKFFLASADKLPADNAKFDKVFTINTIYFWENPQSVLAEIWRVLKPGGKILISVRPKSIMELYPFVKYGFNMFNADDLINLLTENNFKVINTIEKDEPEREISGKKMEIKTLIICAEK